MSTERRRLMIFLVVTLSATLGALLWIGHGSLGWALHVALGSHSRELGSLDRSVGLVAHTDPTRLGSDEAWYLQQHMPEAFPLLVTEALERSCPSPRLPWLLALGPEPDATDALLALFREDRGPVSFQAGRALGRSEEPAATDALLDALADGSDRQRRAALAAARRGDLPEICDADLFDRLRDQPRVREALRRAGCGGTPDRSGDMDTAVPVWQRRPIP